MTCPRSLSGPESQHENWGQPVPPRAPQPVSHRGPGPHELLCALFCLELPVQVLKPATFTDTAHYPLLLVV